MEKIIVGDRIKAIFNGKIIFGIITDTTYSYTAGKIYRVKNNEGTDLGWFERFNIELLSRKQIYGNLDRG